MARDGPLPCLGKCTFLNKFPTFFALQFLCGQSNALIVTAKSLDTVFNCNRGVTKRDNYTVNYIKGI